MLVLVDVAGFLPDFAMRDSRYTTTSIFKELNKSRSKNFCFAPESPSGLVHPSLWVSVYAGLLLNLFAYA
jgi:hypothetical protein